MASQQNQYAPDEDLNVFGMSVHNVVFAFMLILANLSAFWSFLILSQAHFTTDYVINHTNTTDTVSMSYQDFTGLEFTLVITVLEWIWTVGLLTIMVSVTLMEMWKLSPAVETFVNRGNVVTGFFIYTSIVAITSISDNCFEDNHTSIKSYPDSSGKVHDHIHTFCSKVHASCVFTWFFGVAFLCAMVMKLNLINLDGNNQSGNPNHLSQDYTGPLGGQSNGNFHQYDAGEVGNGAEEMGSFHESSSASRTMPHGHYDADRGSMSSVNSFGTPSNELNTADL